MEPLEKAINGTDVPARLTSGAGIILVSSLVVTVGGVAGDVTMGDGDGGADLITRESSIKS